MMLPKSYQRHALPLPDLARERSGLDGTAPDVLEQAELLVLLARKKSADFAMTELHRHDAWSRRCNVHYLSEADI